MKQLGSLEKTVCVFPKEAVLTFFGLIFSPLRNHYEMFLFVRMADYTMSGFILL